MDFSHIPLYDHHCHALRRLGAPLDAVTFRRHFSETTDPAMAPHLANTLFYRRGLRDLAALLGCEPTEQGLLAARELPSPEAHIRRLIAAANIDVMLVDTGFRSAENYSLDEQRALLPCAVHEVLRIEALAEQLIARSRSFAELEEQFRDALRDLRARNIVALKSIAAYRGGLAVLPRSREEAAATYPALREQARRYGRVRLAERALLDYLLRIAVAAAAAQELPVQFHVGLGDDDVDLRTGGPLALRALLQDEALRGARLVLLHCWPYVREAGYLASIYGHVYLDLSLTIPFTAHGGVAAIRQALELAPLSKLLLATDAFSIPELFYLGARYLRQSLHEALSQLQQQGWLTADEVDEAALLLLHHNAASLYGA
jgi:uncharacterized protein